MSHILVVHPKETFRDFVFKTLRDQHEIKPLGDFKAAREELDACAVCDAILCGYDKIHTIGFFRKARERWAKVRLVLVVSTANSLDQVKEFADAWKGNTTAKADSPEERIEWLRDKCSLGDILHLFPSGVEARISEVATRAAENDSPVLIVGERGTGKRTLAEQLHERSRRGKAGRPFSVFNCEEAGGEHDRLFGSTQFKDRIPGSFSLLEMTDGGTLVLAGIESLPWSLQMKLVSVLGQATMGYTTSAGRTAAAMDVRVIATANLSLRPLLSNRFSEDLFYLLAANYIELPRLHQRQTELIQLAHEFWKRALGKAEADSKAATSEATGQVGDTGEFMTPSAERILRSYPWPGNFTELNFAMRHAALRCTDKIEPVHLPTYIVNVAARKVEAVLPGMLFE